VILDGWRSLGPVARALVGTVVVVIGLNLLIGGVTFVTGGSGPGGPASSSYATAEEGLAAYAELLGQRGHPVRQLRESLDRAGLDPRTTLVLADPRNVTREEGRAMAGFLGAGGRLVASGSSAAPVVAALLGGGPEWDDVEVRSARPLVPVPEVAGVASVETAGTGAWIDAGGTLPALAGPDGVLLVVASVGPGRVVGLADTSPLQNRLLARADNAALAVALVGEAGRPVAFAEAHHGYGRSTGLGAVPSRWRWAAALGFVAAVVWMWSRGRRLGPADDVERPQAPARKAYVEAMAASLARTRQPAVAVAPLQDRARRRLAERAGLPADASDDALRRAAVDLRLPADEADALLRPPRTDDDVVAVGRAVARLEERRP
jgi:hypothetical protein